MPFSLYAAVVPPMQKMLGNLDRLLEKAEEYCQVTGVPAEQLIGARLAEDMLPFAYQIKSAVVHSAGALEGVRRGTFSPDMSIPPETFSGLKQKIAEGQAALAEVRSVVLDDLTDEPMIFEIKTYRATFTADQFLLTFSIPNFYFHATTAYDILRAEGLPIGKVDYIGQLPLRKTAS